MVRKIKPEDLSLFNKFFATEPIALNGKLKYLVGNKDRGFFVEIAENDNYLQANLELDDFPTDILDEFENRVRKQGLEINYKVNGGLQLTMNYTGLNSTIKFLSILRILFRILLSLKPNYTWDKWGEILINTFGYEISVLSRDYDKPIKTGWRGEIIVILPDENEWIKTSIGLDNMKLPILSYIKDEVYSYAPLEDNSLRPLSLTRILEKIKLLAESTNALLVHIPKDEADLLRNLNELLGTLEMLKLSIKGGMPLLTTSEFSTPIDELIDEIERDLKLLQRIITFDNILRIKIAIKQAVQMVKEMLEGKRGQGVIVSNIRKVTKLGGGKAIYIGKEELRAIKLGDRVIVKVVEEMGKKKLIIEPI